jgi:hypothetical protein
MLIYAISNSTAYSYISDINRHINRHNEYDEPEPVSNIAAQARYLKKDHIAIEQTQIAT